MEEVSSTDASDTTVLRIINFDLRSSIPGFDALYSSVENRYDEIVSAYRNFLIDKDGGEKSYQEAAAKNSAINALDDVSLVIDAVKILGKDPQSIDFNLE